MAESERGEPVGTPLTINWNMTGLAAALLSPACWSAGRRRMVSARGRGQIGATQQRAGRVLLMTTQSGAASGPEQEETPAGPAPVPARPQQPHRIRRTRLGGLWVAAALSALVLLLLLIFILQNSRLVAISYFGGHGHLPLGVALLLAAVLGVLLVAIPGTGRIIQLRRTARRHERLDTDQPAPEVAMDTPAAARSTDG
jgi:uncharacterized integral membrane protein